MKLTKQIKDRLRVWRMLCPLLFAPAWDVDLMLKQAVEWQPNDIY